MPPERPDDEPCTITPGEMAERTGTSVDTLRYYEREGLITGVVRSASGHRRYGQPDVEWVDVLRCLRLTGMSIAQMKRYAELVDGGDATHEQRHRLLLEHGERVRSEIAELEAALRVVEHKVTVYGELAGRHEGHTT